jgi:hypothetical protein
MSVKSAYPKGDLRRLLAVLGAIEETEQATLVKVVARTGLDKKTVTHLVAQAREQANVEIGKVGPVYTVEDWGPVIQPEAGRLALQGALITPVVSTADLIEPLGHRWVACTDAFPWNDYNGRWRYVVYSPSYSGELMVCSFDLGKPHWWSEALEMGISGVTHWRLARTDERESFMLEGPLPSSTEVDALDLVPLRNWWNWYRQDKRITAEHCDVLGA